MVHNYAAERCFFAYGRLLFKHIINHTRVTIIVQNRQWHYDVQVQKVFEEKDMKLFWIKNIIIDDKCIDSVLIELFNMNLLSLFSCIPYCHILTYSCSYTLFEYLASILPICQYYYYHFCRDNILWRNDEYITLF